MNVRQSILDSLGVVCGAVLGMWGIDLLMSLDRSPTETSIIRGVALLILSSFLGSVAYARSLLCARRKVDDESAAGEKEARMKSDFRQRGFTLIQISILLIVAGLVMVNILPSLQSSLNRNNSTTTKMNSILTALRQYESVNAALPCPADASQPINSTSYGVAAGGIGATNNCTGGSPAANYVDSTNHVAIGMVPVRALALPKDYALDAYGRDITYAVDTNATSCFAGSLTGQITVTDNGTAANTVAALVSHGMDGHGAWIPLTGSTGTAVRLNAGSTDTDQLTNAHVNASFNPTTTLTNFVRKPLTATFDDLVVYNSPLWTLNKAPAASSAAWPTISPPANGTYSSGQVLSFTLKYQQSVVVTGIPYLSLSAITGSIGTGNVAKATYQSGSGTNALTFSYTVAGSDSAPTGLTILPTIYLNGGTMTVNGDPVCLPFTAPNLTGVIIITTVLYVTDQNNFRVQAFNGSGVYQSQFGSAGTGNGQFGTFGPQGIAIDSSGNIWVVDSKGNRIEKFNSSGTYLGQLGGCGSGACSASNANGQFNGPNGLVIDSSGNFWVADSSNFRVEKFNSSGTFLMQFPCASGQCSSGSANGQFGAQGPQQIAIDPVSGSLWVVDETYNRVEKFNSSGTYQTAVGSGYQGAGGSVGSSGTTKGRFDVTWGVAVDASGNVWVADFGGNRVQEFNSSGTYLGQIGCAGTNLCANSAANGQFNGTDTVSFDSSGNMWVTDGNNQRVEEFNSSGTWLQSIGGPTPHTCETSPAGSSPACASGNGNGQFNTPNYIAISSQHGGGHGGDGGSGGGDH